MIRLHWWNEVSNFGDALSRTICERLSRRWTEWAPLETSQLLGIGSLLGTHLYPQQVWSRFQGIVWGSGCMFPGNPPQIARNQVAAVRGPRTASALGITDSSICGDPALLVREIVLSPNRESHVLGFVPHWSDRSHPLFRSALVDHPDVLVIDPTEEPTSVVERIASCRFILSSSLHGLVVADAFQVPSRWIRFNTGQEETVGAGLFKFEDYFALWQRSNETPLIPRPDMQIEDYLCSIQCDRDYSLLDRLCANLKATFPLQR